MKTIQYGTTIILTILCSTVFAQNPDLNTQITEAESDSMFTSKSQIIAKIGFDSRVLVAGRDWDVAQYSLSPMLGYYHKSGFNTSFTGIILSDSDPKYNQSIINIGYGKNLGSHFYSSISYNRFIFNPHTEGLIQNSLNAYLGYSLKFLSLGASYTALFEPEKAKQINLSISGFWEKLDVGKIESISFNPNMSLLLGTQTVVLQRFSNTAFQRVTGKTWQNRLSARSKQTTEEKIAPLSFNISLPITAQWGRIQTSFIFNYIIPFAQENEDLTEESLDKTFYISASMAFRLFEH